VCVCVCVCVCHLVHVLPHLFILRREVSEVATARKGHARVARRGGSIRGHRVHGVEGQLQRLTVATLEQHVHSARLFACGRSARWVHNVECAFRWESCVSWRVGGLGSGVNHSHTQRARVRCGGLRRESVQQTNGAHYEWKEDECSLRPLYPHAPEHISHHHRQSPCAHTVHTLAFIHAYIHC